MKPEKLTVYQLFEKQQRYVVPLFQRPYVWDKEHQWVPLWEDICLKAMQIMERGSNDETIGSHFLGAAVINELKTFGKQVRRYEIIDGQQRLTTLQVLLAAFRSFLKHIQFDDEALLGELARLVVNSGTRAEEIEKYKVWPTTADRVTYESIVVASNPEHLRKILSERQSSAPLLAEAYEFFFAMIDEFVRYGETDDEIDSPEFPYDSDMARDRIDALMEALKRHLEIVIIELEKGDDPQIIFETLNARGVPLLPSDLIRNFVFLQAANLGEDIDALYHKYWLKFDDYEHGQAKFWKDQEEQGRAARPRIDLFMFHYLVLRTGNEIPITHLFQEFRRWWQHQFKPGDTVERTLADMSRYAEKYRWLFTLESKSRLGVFVRRLRTMDMTTLYPLLLYFVTERADIPPAEMDGILTDLESYVVRRMVCGLSARGYNRTFMLVLRDLRRADTLNRAVVRDALAAFEGDNGRWPDDDEFKHNWLTVAMYNRLVRARMRLILEALDLQMMTHKQEQLHIESDLTIEHVYPQSPDETEWPELPDRALKHSVGNLTLLTSALNGSISNGPFHAKRPEIAKQSALRMNVEFQTLSDDTVWDADHIRARGERLFEIALVVWPRPAQAATTRLNAGTQRAVDSLCAVADENGIGEAFRMLVDSGLRHGFYPRVEPKSILFAPHRNKNVCLFTIWATSDTDLLKAYVSTDAFPEYYPMGTDALHEVLGTSGWRSWRAEDAAAFGQALDSLLPKDA